MKVLYVAKHGQRVSNDDEGAIAHALRGFGIEVICIGEHEGPRAVTMARQCNWLLMHKWSDRIALSQIKVPRVLWYFDLVGTANDASVKARGDARRLWFKKTLPVIDVGFASDGDFVDNDRSGKMEILRQGADERYAGPGTAGREVVPILFTGIARRAGNVRMEFVQAMEKAYGSMFRHVPAGTHGKPLADLIASSHVAVAPTSPVTDRYWSNRVYLSLGFGAFMLHPYCAGLEGDYRDGEEIVYYRGIEDLHDKIRHYLREPEQRQKIAKAGLERTLGEHTYRHRVTRLLDRLRCRGLI